MSYAACTRAFRKKLKLKRVEETDTDREREVTILAQGAYIVLDIFDIYNVLALLWGKAVAVKLPPLPVPLRGESICPFLLGVTSLSAG